jgi:hypothetical protein
MTRQQVIGRVELDEAIPPCTFDAALNLCMRSNSGTKQEGAQWNCRTIGLSGCRRQVGHPVLKNHDRVHSYKRRSWGPKQADAILAPDGTWHNPHPREASGKDTAAVARAHRPQPDTPAPHPEQSGEILVKATQKLHDLGQSLWLDNITRGLLMKGTLRRYIEELLSDLPVIMR